MLQPRVTVSVMHMSRWMMEKIRKDNIKQTSQNEQKFTMKWLQDEERREEKR